MNVLFSSALAHSILLDGDIREGQGIKVTLQLWVKSYGYYYWLGISGYNFKGGEE